jgi:hypothetical protein
MNEKGEEQSWSFTVEPRINGVTRGGAGDGILRVGDLVVAIDGIPITTRDGGRRFANVDPGQEVDLLLRRNGQLVQVSIVAGSVCPPPPPKPVAPLAMAEPVPDVMADTVPPPAPPAVVVGRQLPPLPPDTLREPGRAVVVAPRIVVAPAARTAVTGRAVPRVPTLARGATAGAGLLGGTPPTGTLGIGFSCSHCGTRTNEESGEDVWYFTGPLEVTSVTLGSPADGAGIQRGDLIRAIDGHDIESDEGGLAFTRIESGKSVQLSIVKRNGSEMSVALIPAESVVTGISTAEAAFSRRAPVLRPDRPSPPDRAAYPAPTVAVDAPADLPFRYSNVVNGVEIEIRGDPVTVSELEGTRTIYIQSDGLWIRIVVPRRGGLISGGTSGGESG